RVPGGARQACLSPPTGSLLRCPAETARHDSWALTKMWQHARRHIDWLQENSQARAEAWDRTWGLGRLPRRAWHPAWERLNFDTGDEDEDPAVAILPEQLAKILGPRPVTGSRRRWSRTPSTRRESTGGTHTIWRAWGPGPGWSIARPAPTSTTGSRNAVAASSNAAGPLCTGPRLPSSRAVFLGVVRRLLVRPQPQPGRRRGGQRDGVTPGHVARRPAETLGPTGPIFPSAREEEKECPCGGPTRFEATVVHPLLAGFRDASSGTEFVVHEGERPAVRAVLLHMYLEARTQWEAWSAQRAAAIGAITPPSPSASALPALPLPPVAYNDKLLDGKPRSFPTRRLAGADAVLARIYHEHTVSKAYTPLLLGEILAARTWTSGNELNRLAVPQKEAGSLHLVGGSLVAADDKRPWEPRGVMSVVDGLEAVRLAWILTTVSDEGDVNEVTADIMADTSSWLEAMATPPPRPEPKKPARPPPPPKAEPDQGADWTPPAQKWQRTGKGKKGQKGQKGGKKGNKGAGKGQERQ
ncbi:POLA2, partial [Symbiodinium sp. CCMP2456]